jgi:AraC-like DNA-binding protein
VPAIRPLITSAAIRIASVAANGAFLLRSSLAPPWSVRIQDEAPLTLVAVVRGTAWVLPDADQATLLNPGDLAIMRGPDPYVFADDPGTEPQAIIHPGQLCTTLDGQVLATLGALGVRAWGNDLDGSAELITGTYQVLGEICSPLLQALPPLAVIRREETQTPLIALLAEEITKEQPGQEAVLDRLLDLLLIAVLRTWLTRPDAETPGWYRAQSDPIVGTAIKLMHDQPARPWTVASLAAETHISRASLARRFTTLVGQPPMAYLANWRLALAADMLSHPDQTIGTIAEKVGYGSSFALSAAFKRVRGISPQQHRDYAARHPIPIAPTNPWRSPTHHAAA